MDLGLNSLDLVRWNRIINILNEDDLLGERESRDSVRGCKRGFQEGV